MGGKGPGSALVNSPILDSDSTPVDLDLKNPVEEWAWVAYLSLNERCWKKE